MKWFKHMTCSGDDEKLSAIMDELGMEGYGFYWRLLEIVAEKLDQKGETSCQFSAKKWGNFFQFSAKKFLKFAQILAEKRLISVEISEKFVKIDIPNLLKYRDNYQKNLQASDKKVSLNNININNNNSIKEKEKEEDINPLTPLQGDSVKVSAPYSQEFNSFWTSYPKKTGKDATWRAWQAKKREKRLPPVTDLIAKVEQFKQSEQWQKEGGQFIPNPATWINQARWLDELSGTGGMSPDEQMAMEFIRRANANANR